MSSVHTLMSVHYVPRMLGLAFLMCVHTVASIYMQQVSSEHFYLLFSLKRRFGSYNGKYISGLPTKLVSLSPYVFPIHIKPILPRVLGSWLALPSLSGERRS